MLHIIFLQRVLILAAVDVDSLCACKLLQHLLNCDTIAYSLIPVADKAELIRAFSENLETDQVNVD